MELPGGVVTRDTDYEVIVTSLACHLSVHRSARTEPLRYGAKYRRHALLIQRYSPFVKRSLKRDLRTADLLLAFAGGNRVGNFLTEL